MIELYGNKIWNSNTPNKYKKVIIASEDSLDNICQELENSGLNYCAYIFNGKAHIAIGRATATNIDKLDIDYQAVIDCNSKIYKTNNIIGTTTYDSIEDKLYRKYNTDFAYKIGQRLTEQGILFSGRIYGKTTTITVDKQYADTLNKISAELKEQRTSFMSKSENDLQEEVKSVDEKISELHFNELQLSALESAISFVNDRNDDTLTDTLLSLFSDCTDFNETQISALAKNYVDTYRKFSGTSLIFADISKFTDLKQRFVNDNITAKLTENRGYSTTQLDIIRDMVAYGMSDSVINLLDYTFSIDEMQNFFTAYKNGSYEDLINLIADIKGTTRTDIEGQIEGGTYTPEIPDYDFLSKNLIFHNPSANHFTVMYFNPDSETGGQFVSTDINYNVAWRGNRDFTNDSERFWRYVEITGNQTLSDVGSKFFRESLNYFYSGEQIAEGLTTDTQKLIADVATAEMIKSGELIEPESFDVAKFDTLISEQKEITSNNSDKNTIVINAFAGPGAGKTTSCLEVAEKLKKQGFVTEYVQEYAKELVYDNNLIMLDGHYEHQFAILNEQMKRINRLYGKVDFIVTDSPILLNNTYLNEDKNTEVYSAYSDSVNKLYGLYNNFNYFVERDTSVFEKEGRIHNLEQSIAIDNELKNMLHNNQIDFDVYTHATIDNIVRDSTIIYAKQLINSYCQDEFDSEADFSDLKKVGVAYTTTEDSKHTVEAVVNLVDYRLETYVDDKLFKEETYADLKDMIDNCLHSLSFDDLVYLSDEELAPFYEEHDELDDVDPAVIRQQLEDAGIVNGELVDEDKLNSDPFIQQVMADAETDAERNFYQNNFDIKVRNYAGALKVSSEEIVNQFNSESEAVPVNEPEQGNIRPTITCDWSESPVFENGKTYSVSEFDTLMKNADDEWVEQRQLEIEEYGSENAVAEAYRNGELDNIHLGYEKTKFIVNMPNGTTHTFRQDIGDGNGGVIDFLKQYPQYSGVVKILEADIKLDKGENEKAADLPITESKEREVRSDENVAGIAELKYQEGNSFKVKDMERTKRSLEQQLEKLQSSKKDNTVYFEELGIDKLFVDEAHEFKNLFCTTKLQNVSGISSRASQRATELFAKCRYLDEKTGGKGVVFATGTPLSNSVTELHTMMRYLNYDFLASHNNMQNFDNWVSTFGVQKKEYELAPAGNKFKERTRIAEYANLPELMSMFKTIADVRTADTLNLKVPDCELHIVDVEPTELQTELVEELSDRADEVNNGSVDPSQDNMLKITGDGRKLGLDPRLINPSFEDDPGTKLNVCVNNVFDIYEKTSDKKLTQIVFCDLGVPSKNSSADGNKDDDTKSVAELDSLEESGKFCVYDDIRDKLIAKGVSADEIAYIHNAKSETQKSELFAKVRSGEVRILLGSTGKMGTGTNVQDRIIALHDLDVPWRPSDLEQRRGRMVRQGNINDKVHLYRYVTKGTFDAYSYQLLEKKQKFISQIMTSKEPGRKCADVDQAALTYSEIKALCTGDERIREKLTLENRVKELQALKSEYNSTRYELEDKVNAYPEERKKLLLDIGNISKDMETVKNIPFDVKTESYRVKITIGKDAYSLLDDESRKVAAKALTNAVAQVKGDANKNKRIAIGGLGNFGVEVINDGYFLDKITATLRGNYTYSVELGVSSIINLKKIENLLFKVENVLNDKKSELNKLDIDYKTAQNMLHKPFEYEDELNNSTKRLDELTTALNIDMSEHKVDKPKKTHYFGKDFILGKKKSSKQIQNNEVMKSEPKRSEPEL